MPSIFICYAHKDNEGQAPSQRWLDRLLEYLAPLELQEQVEIWSDREIELGEDWHNKIQLMLQQVKAAVLLVSPSFLASKYIRNSELPVLLKKARDEGVVILPIILRQCLWKETKFKFPDPQKGPEELSLSDIQVPTTNPLNSLPEYEQDQVLYQVAQRISQIVKKQINAPNSVPIGKESLHTSNSVTTNKSSATQSNTALSSLTPSQRRRLERERDDLQEPYSLLSQKLRRLRKAHAVETDPNVKFKLEMQIEETQGEVDKIELRIEEIEQKLS